MCGAILVVAAYLCGSLPTGVWFAHRQGVDVRRSGSGNVGATNVARTAGMRAALLTLAGDIGKGLLPALLARRLLTDPWLIAAVGVAAFLGHVFSAFLQFSGGKGVATGFGVFLGLAPAAAAASALVFLTVALATRYVSLASVIAAATLALATAALRQPLPVQAAALVVATVIVARHRENLSRLRAGTEPTFQIRRAASAR